MGCLTHALSTTSQLCFFPYYQIIVHSFSSYIVPGLPGTRRGTVMRRLTILFSISIVLFILMTHVAFAQANDTIPDIIKIKHSITTIQELEQQGILTHADAEKSIAYYVTQASQAVGHTLTLNEIM